MKIAFDKRSPGWWLVVSCLLTGALLLAGCSEPPATGPSVNDLAQQRAANKAAGGHAGGAAAKPKAPGAQGKEGPKAGESFASGGEGYRYDPVGKRDPFRSFRFVDVEVSERVAGPLGDYELGQLRLSAVIWEANNPRALVQDPGGRSFIVREGSAIGKNNGRVIHIGDNLLLVKETYVDFAGNQTTKDVELRIRRSQGG